jgi:serine/threonine protein kinase
MPVVRGYRDLTRIGRGGFSSVYRAKQVYLGRDVAIKILMADLADDAEARRFANECAILGRLGVHRHVVDVYEAGITDEGRPFIVMRFYARGTLGDRMKASAPMLPSEVISTGIKMAEALQAAHFIGVIHRDIKPDNILMDDDGEPVLSDFGVSAVADAAGRYTSSVAFSHAHASPEVLDRNAYGIASDVYSLGSTLYTLLTGRAAFAADTEARQIVAIMNDPPPPIDLEDVPEALKAVILGAMSKDPRLRPQTARDLGRSLEEIQSHGAAARGEPRVLTQPDTAPFDADVTIRRPLAKPTGSEPTLKAERNPGMQQANGVARSVDPPRTGRRSSPICARCGSHNVELRCRRCGGPVVKLAGKEGWYVDRQNRSREVYWPPDDTEGSVRSAYIGALNHTVSREAGWYLDPSDEFVDRFWDGVIWTDRTRDAWGGDN